MELQPYGPLEEATNQSISSDPSVLKRSTKFWWGALTATLVYGFLFWIASSDYKIIRRDEEPLKPR